MLEIDTSGLCLGLSQSCSLLKCRPDSGPITSLNPCIAREEGVRCAGTGLVAAWWDALGQAGQAQWDAAGEGRVGESQSLPWPCLLLRDAAQGGSAVLHGAC